MLKNKFLKFNKFSTFKKFSTFIDFPIFEIPKILGDTNTMVRVADRILVGRQNFVNDDNAREKELDKLKEHYQPQVYTSNVKHLLFVAEKAWLYSPVRQLYPEFKIKLEKNNKTKYPNLKVITLAACQSAEFAEMVSIFTRDTFVVGLVPPIGIGVPFVARRLDNDGTLIMPSSKFYNPVISTQDLVVYWNGQRVPDELVRQFAPALTESIYCKH